MPIVKHIISHHFPAHIQGGILKKTGAEILVDALRQEHVDILFGYPGGQAIPLFDALYDAKDIKVVLVRHEQAAAHAADGYARATGKVGVCLATSGPGATNLITGIATAYMDSIPMVAITAQVGTHLLGTDAFQEADIVGISRPVTKHNFLVKNVKDLPLILKQAFYIARSGRPGPVLVDLPRNVAIAALDDYAYPESVAMRSYKPTTVGHPRQIEKAAELIAQSQKPLIFAGGGVIIAEAAAELKEFAERINAPVTLTLMGLGGLSATNPLFVGMPGMHGSKTANYAFQNCDLIISIGARFDDRVTGHVGSFAPKAKVIHIDIDPAAISKIIRVDIPVVGDAKNILTQLNKIIKPASHESWIAELNTIRGARLFSYKNSDTVIKPQFVLEQINAYLDDTRLITTEVGQHQMWAAQYLRIDKPRTFLSSGGLGTMGFGFPAAMGAAMATKKTAIVIAGDGSIQMNIQELATVAINRIPVKIVILNNEYLGMVRQWQELFHKRRYAATCLRDGVQLCGECAGPENCDKQYIPDFVALAKSYSVPAFRAKTPAEVDSVLKAGLGIEGPALMEFMVAKEENVYPMVPAGRSLTEILEEDV